MRIIYCAETIIDANLVKGALEAEGIRAFVSGEYLVGALGELPCWNLVNVMVADADVEGAAPIARAIDAALSEPMAEDEAHCGADTPRPAIAGRVRALITAAARRRDTLRLRESSPTVPA